jgi:predicted enzyme related to lactoylglutathione lyase
MCPLKMMLATLRNVVTFAAIGLFMFSSSGAPAQEISPLPPLTEPPTNSYRLGKFVWADLFTNRFETVRDFYQSLFPALDWHLITAGPEPYGIFYLDGLPVSGVAFRESPDGDTSTLAYGRWVHYLSVDDVEDAESVVLGYGGRTVLPRRNIAERGEFAIVASEEGSLLGLIRSSSGDPSDYTAILGEWFWRELYSPNPQLAAEVYTKLCECNAFPSEPNSENYLLSSDGFLRGGIVPTSLLEGGVPAWIGYILVEDVDNVVERAVVLGASIITAPSEDIGNGNIAVISDPSGAYLGLVNRQIAEQTGLVE